MKIDIEGRADGEPQRLVVAADLTEANGYAERGAAESDDRASCTGRLSLGADKGYDASAFVADLRALNATLQSHRA